LPPTTPPAIRTRSRNVVDQLESVIASAEDVNERVLGGPLRVPRGQIRYGPEPIRITGFSPGLAIGS